MQKTIRTFVTLAALSALLTGCNQSAPPPSAPASSPKPKVESAARTEPHGAHGAGPHDGAVADWGGGKYHVEFTVDHDKQEATIYVLGSDEKTPAPVKAADGKLMLTIADPAMEVELDAVPQDGDPDGTSSRFVGKHENLGHVQEFAGTISGEVEGTPYTGDFKEEPPSDEKK